jgi:hypothetical protein
MCFLTCFCLICWKAGWTNAPPDTSLWNMLTATHTPAEQETSVFERVPQDASMPRGDAEEVVGANTKGFS